MSIDSVNLGTKARVPFEYSFLGHVGSICNRCGADSQEILMTVQNLRVKAALAAAVVEDPVGIEPGIIHQSHIRGYRTMSECDAVSCRASLYLKNN